MKRFLAVLLAISVASFVFTACASGNKDSKTTTEYKFSTTKAIATDDAKITEADAVNLIKEQYSAEELGLSEEDYESCSFMVSSSGIKYDGSYYVKVIAAVKEEIQDKDGNISYSFDTKGEYLISFDGTAILMKDMTAENETYKELEVRSTEKTE